MIFIRTDSNNEVATGHVMRCMTIADKLIKYGEKVKFIVKDVDTVNLLDGKFEYININIARLVIRKRDWVLKNLKIIWINLI